MAVCPQCGGANPERARFCLECGTPMSTEPSGRGESRRTVTVIFSDVTGSTALGERHDAESLRRVMARYFERMKAVLARHGGRVEKFIGDAVMAVFGIPEVHEDDAIRAVRAATEMGEELQRLNVELERSWGVRLQVRTGVNTGEVVAGDGGQTLVTGDAVNVAARLEQAAEPGEILLGPTTYRLVRDAVRVEAVEPLILKGKQAPLAAMRLLEVFSQTPGHVRHLEIPLVAREHEVRLVDWAYERATKEQTAHLLTVFGAAGVGKSRLVAEMVNRLEGRALVLRGECPAYGEGITFWPAAQVVRDAALLVDTDGPDEARAKLVAALDDDEAPIVDRLAELLGLSGAPGSMDETSWAFRRLLEALARDQPVVAVFDDLHWAESSFLDLIDHVADWSRAAPILLVCMARPELLERRPGWGGGKLNATAIQLGPLSDPEAAQLLRQHLGDTELAEPARAKIIAAAEGNPLYVEEMLAVLMDEGLLRLEGGCWMPTVDLETVGAPPTIQALLAARLDQLDAGEGTVLRRASVSGKSFTAAAVAELSPESERPNVLSTLLGLARKELIRQERPVIGRSNAFQFRHMLVRDAAYESLPKQERADLHERFAQWLEREAAEPASAVDELVGHHLEAAHRHRLALGPADARTMEIGRRASAGLARAGRDALVRGDMAAAASLLSRAVALAEAEAPERGVLLHDLGMALADEGAVDEAEKAFDEAASLAAAAGDRPLEAHVRISRLELRLVTDPTAIMLAADEEAERLISTVEALGDECVLARAWHFVTLVAWNRCQAADAEAALARAVTHARAAGDVREEAAYLANLTSVLVFGPTPVDLGVARCTEVLERATELGRPGLEGRALQALGCLRAMQGDFAEGRRLVGRGIGILEDLGLAHWLPGALQVQGIVEELAGDLPAAEAAYRKSYELFEARAAKSYMSTAAAMLANVLSDMGRDDEADQLAGVSEVTAAPDDIDSQVQWRRARAKVLARRGSTPRAEELAIEAVALSRRTDLSLYADLLMDVGVALATDGRDGEAARFLKSALGAYERKGNRVSADRAAQALARLPAGLGTRSG